jgi:toxin FitB
MSVVDSKRVLQQRSEADALRVTAVMKQARVVELDSELALAAARLSFDLKLPLADSVIYATARRYDAIIWTQDKDFEGLANVRYVAKI